MHFSASLIIAALSFLVTARYPLRNRQSNAAYVLAAINSGDQDVHHQPIVAAAEYFFIGRQADAICKEGSQATPSSPTQITLANFQAVLVSHNPG